MSSLSIDSGHGNCTGFGNHTQFHHFFGRSLTALSGLLLLGWGITHNFTVLLAATDILLDLGITHNFTILSGQSILNRKQWKDSVFAILLHPLDVPLHQGENAPVDPSTSHHLRPRKQRQRVACSSLHLSSR